MPFSPVDTVYQIIKETTAGTLPGSGTWLSLPVDITGSLPNLEADTITSPIARPTRSSDGARRVNYRGEGAFALHLQQSSAIELLMSSVLSGAFATNVLKGSNSDQPFSVEEKIATSQYRRFLGNYGTNMSLTVDFNGNALLGFSYMGMSGVTATTASSITDGTAPVTTKLTGLDAGTITVGALSGLVFNRAVLTVDQPRAVQGQFGSASAYGIGATGPRAVRLELQCYHADLTPFTSYLTTDTPIAVSMTIGGASAGFTFLLPAAVPETPKRTNGDSAVMTTLAFVGTHDATEATDIKITKL